MTANYALLRPPIQVKIRDLRFIPESSEAKLIKHSNRP